MISFVGLVVLICAVAINADPQCNVVIKGDITTSVHFNLEPVYLQPSVRDYKVTIPHLAQCTNGESGVKAIICDEDVAPEGKLLDLYTLIVNRRGNLQSVGTVLITVYCI
ncbi:uncharacterized protein LOC118278740 [Spodoptera frugiperda]|uniref:Uncharacterized protein LOC118278740 n=1 Tax=Spodoptera frugiperda TaxID=7108 RepID=A0A9R0DHS9_SPOFR|nr:uncharacterized protein LOC118278740 [Spodoptera frugiperda]